MEVHNDQSYQATSDDRLGWMHIGLGKTLVNSSETNWGDEVIDGNRNGEYSLVSQRNS